MTAISRTDIDRDVLWLHLLDSNHFCDLKKSIRIERSDRLNLTGGGNDPLRSIHLKFGIRSQLGRWVKKNRKTGVAGGMKGMKGIERQGEGGKKKEIKGKKTDEVRRRRRRRRRRETTIDLIGSGSDGLLVGEAFGIRLKNLRGYIYGARSWHLVDLAGLLVWLVNEACQIFRDQPTAALEKGLSESVFFLSNILYRQLSSYDSTENPRQAPLVSSIDEDGWLGNSMRPANGRAETPGSYLLFFSWSNHWSFVHFGFCLIQRFPVFFWVGLFGCWPP